MNTIKGQIPNVTLAMLREKSKMYFPYIEWCLKQAGLPEDFKYIPIIECGFRNLQSGAGARGFWQLMPDVAIGMGMVVTSTYDERDDPGRSTQVACRLIRQIFSDLKRHTSISSWVLTAASYNFGIGNIEKAMRSQGQQNYFQMKLNKETAAYVYKLIAIKELFEYPELYMKGFNTNIFSSTTATEAKEADINELPQGPKTQVAEEFSTIEVDAEKKAPANVKIMYVSARIVSTGAKFRDGGALKLELKSDLHLASEFKHKGNSILGHGWVIDNRVYVDLGYDHEVEVLDNFKRRGLTPDEAAQDGQYVLLKTEVPAD